MNEDYYSPPSALNESGRLALLAALKRKYESEALDALRRAALTDDENVRTYNVESAIQHIRYAKEPEVARETEMNTKTTSVEVHRSEFNAEKIVISKRTGCYTDGLLILTEQEAAQVIKYLSDALAVNEAA